MESKTGPDASLLEELATGLDAAFEQLVLAYQDRLYRFALRMTGAAEEAEEIAQDAFVRSYRALQGYNSDRIRALALQSWLYQIALNVTRNRVRGKRLLVVPLDQHMDATGWEPEDDARLRPEVLAERRDGSRELAALVAELPQRYRAAVVLRHIEELSYDEIAALLHQPAGTVKSNVHRGLELLRNALAAAGRDLAGMRG